MQLVFEHSLRIRLKSEAPDVYNGALHVANPSSFAQPPITANGTQDPTATDFAGSARRKMRDNSNLIGKINNLITSDLRNISDGRDFLTLCESCLTPSCTLH